MLKMAKDLLEIFIKFAEILTSSHKDLLTGSGHIGAAGQGLRIRSAEGRPIRVKGGL